MMATTSRVTADVSLGAVLKFLVFRIKSRCCINVKAERALAADRIISIGLKDFSDETAVVLHVQTSDLPSEPHPTFYFF